ncbi:glycosyltransferase family 1 protein [Thozetella sp. PMI_491]|nr:glycosyltransferase family 1 protein [Thozetella sp. PMI_491]
MGIILSHIYSAFSSNGSAAAVTESKKPIIVAAAMPASGHTIPLIQIAKHLVQAGFEVYLIAGADFQTSIQQAKISYVPHPWKPKFKFDSHPPDKAHGPPKNFFLDSTPDAFRAVTECLESVRKRYPGRQVILLNEAMYMGILPFYYGAPLPKGYDRLPRVINYHTTFNPMTSVDLDPQSGLPITASAEERAKVGGFGPGPMPDPTIMNEHANAVYRQLGATKDVTGRLFDLMIDSYDICLMSYSPSLDYPRSDLSPKIKFIGGLPPRMPSPNLLYPSWWAEIEANSALSAPARKKIVFVTQGTVMCDYNDLIVPTIKALAAREDIIVIAVLGVRQAVLPEDVEIPANVKVLDYFPYSALLPHTDVFVVNAGFGGFIQGIMFGVPMVMAGKGIDKGIVSERAARCGAAVNLYARNPTVEALARGIDEVLGNPEYKRRAEAMRRENISMDALGSIEKVILDLTE